MIYGSAVGGDGQETESPLSAGGYESGAESQLPYFPAHKGNPPIEWNIKKKKKSGEKGGSNLVNSLNSGSSLWSPGSDSNPCYPTLPPLIHEPINSLLHKLCAGMLSRVWLLAILWTVTHQAPLSMEFSRQEYWNRLPYPPPGDLANPGIKSMSLVSPALAYKVFTTGNSFLKLSWFSIICHQEL